jgi:hypothetical protein
MSIGEACMFSEKVILQKLARFTDKFGWTPIRHSLDEIERAKAEIMSLCQRNDKGELYFDDRSYTPKITRFILNERAMCAIDCEYFLTHYYKIAADNRIVQFTLRAGQRVFYRVIQDLEARDKSYRNSSPKGEAAGDIDARRGDYDSPRPLRPGAKCAIGSADGQKTYVMMGMMYTALEHLPWWLGPTQTKDRRSGAPILEFDRVGTSIVVQSGSMKGGIGQGTTPTAIHLSECCDYTNPIVQIEEGLFMAVHSSPDIFMVLESTGNGNTGWWADQWRTNKEKYWQGGSRLLPSSSPGL